MANTCLTHVTITRCNSKKYELLRENVAKVLHYFKNHPEKFKDSLIDYNNIRGSLVPELLAIGEELSINEIDFYTFEYNEIVFRSNCLPRSLIHYSLERSSYIEDMKYNEKLDFCYFSLESAWNPPYKFLKVLAKYLEGELSLLVEEPGMKLYQNIGDYYWQNYKIDAIDIHGDNIIDYFENMTETLDFLIGYIKTMRFLTPYIGVLEKLAEFEGENYEYDVFNALTDILEKINKTIKISEFYCGIKLIVFEHLSVDSI